MLIYKKKKDKFLFFSKKNIFPKPNFHFFLDNLRLYADVTRYQKRDDNYSSQENVPLKTTGNQLC